MKKKSTTSQQQRNPQGDLMVYRSAQFEEWAKGRNILSIALDVHMTTEGSYDRSEEDQENDILAIKWVLQYWKYTGKVFDALVLSLLGFVVKEAGEDVV